VKNYTAIYVNPVSRPSVQGRHKQVYTILAENSEIVPLRGMNKNKEFGVTEEYTFPFNIDKNRLETGLDMSIRNDFYQMDVDDIIKKYALSSDWATHLERIVKSDKIKKQTLFEILDAVPYNYYTSEVNGSIYKNEYKRLDEPPNYLQTFSIILYDGPNYFEDTSSRGRLAIQLCKLHSKIAASKSVINSSLHSFYISKEDESLIEGEVRADLINEAIYHLHTLLTKSGEFKTYQVASVLKDYQNIPLVKGTVSPVKVKTRLNEYIHTKDKYQEMNVDKFLEIMKMLNSKEGSERFNVLYLVQQALNTDVLGNRDGYFLWHSKADVPNLYKFSDYEKLINFLINEMRTYNPKDESVTNYYRDLIEELSAKGIKLST